MNGQQQQQQNGTTSSNSEDDQKMMMNMNGSEIEGGEYRDGDDDYDSEDDDYDSEDDDYSDSDDSEELAKMQTLLASIKEQRLENQRLTESLIKIHQHKKSNNTATQRHQQMFDEIMALSSSSQTSLQGET